MIAIKSCPNLKRVHVTQITGGKTYKNMFCFVKEVVQIAALIFHDYLPGRISGDKFFAVFYKWEDTQFVYVDQFELGKSITEKTLKCWYG